MRQQHPTSALGRAAERECSDNPHPAAAQPTPRRGGRVIHGLPESATALPCGEVNGDQPQYNSFCGKNSAKALPAGLWDQNCAESPLNKAAAHTCALCDLH